MLIGITNKHIFEGKSQKITTIEVVENLIEKGRMLCYDHAHLATQNFIAWMWLTQYSHGKKYESQYSM